MAKYSNRSVNVEIGVEPTRGGGPEDTTIKFLLPKSSITFDDKAPKLKKNASLGNRAMNRGDLLEDTYAEGSFEGELRDRSFGLVLLNALGSVSTASVTGDTYKHTYTFQDDSQTDSIYIKIHDPAKSILFRNVMLSNVEISVTMGDIVSFSCEWVGNASDSTTTDTPTRITEYNFTKNHAKIYIAATTGDLDSASRLSIKSATLNFNNGTIEHDSSLGTAEPEDFLAPNGYMITGTLELNYEDDTFKNYMLDNTSRAMRFELVNTDVSLDSGNPQLLVDFTDVYFEGWEPDPSLEDIRKQSITFEAHWDEVNERFFDDAFINNEQTAYA